MHELDSWQLTGECVLSVRTACWLLRWDRAIGRQWRDVATALQHTLAESQEGSWIGRATQRLFRGDVSR